jgi:putative ABC transport system permease protein
MIGVGVVALFTVLAASVKTSVNNQINASFAGDLVVNPGGFGRAGVSPDVARQIATKPQVATVTALRRGVIALDGSTQEVMAGDPSTLGRVIDVGVTKGSLANLDNHGIAVAKNTAKKHHWHVGSTVTARFTDGTTKPVRVDAIYDQTGVVGNYLVADSLWKPHELSEFDSLVAVKLAGGVSLDQGRAAIEPTVNRLATSASVQDRKEFSSNEASAIDRILALVYGLLFLAIIISLMGIANTLALSIGERTRELGLLRAIGTSRQQVRSSVRWESVIVSLFGTVGGIALGLFFGWALVMAASGEGVVFTVPAARLVTVVVLGALVGVVAAIRPARSAARLNVLQAVAAD